MAGLVRAAALIGLMAWHSPTHAPADKPADSPALRGVAEAAAAGGRALAGIDPDGSRTARLAAQAATQIPPEAKAELARLVLIAARGAIAVQEGRKPAASP